MEFVFVVPRNVLFPDWYPHGLVPFIESSQRAGAKLDHAGASLSQSAFETAVADEGFFVERAYAERKPELKQVIPYCVVECDGRVLLSRRLGTGGESRLHDKHSIGIGGHINPEDLDPAASDSPLVARRDPIGAGARREIEEELTVRGSYDLHPIGILNDDSNPVGAVHVGVVHLIRVRGSVEIRERDQLEGRLVAPDELRAMLAAGTNFETWSTLLIPRLDELLTKPNATHPRIPREPAVRNS